MRERWGTRALIDPLQNQWQITSGQWHDAVRHRFELDFLQEYDCTLPPVLSQMDRLAEIITQARRSVR